SEIERYTRAAEQERLNAAAMAKQLENKKLANSPGQVGKRLEAKQKKSGVALPRGLATSSLWNGCCPPWCQELICREPCCAVGIWRLPPRWSMPACPSTSTCCNYSGLGGRIFRTS